MPANVDAVLSYHMSPFACGVAKFNQQLAQRLGVPMRPLSHVCRFPLVSIKPSEMDDRDRATKNGEWSWPDHVYDLLLHDRTWGPAREDVQRARRVFYADEIGCPSTLEGNPKRGEMNVLLFGMSHKLNGHPVRLTRLRALLDQSGQDYTVSVSTAVHEGSPWDGAFTTTCETLRAIFSDKLRVLGYLADDALARELRTCQAVALFFDPAARANNTSLWAAMEAGAPVITNLDQESPADLIHNQTVFDLDRMTEWPALGLRMAVESDGQRAAQEHSWDKLLAILHG